MRSRWTGMALVLLAAAAACAPLTPDAGSPAAEAVTSGSTMSDAVVGRDPYYGRHTTVDVWGHVVPAPGEDTSHGGSTTQSLGVLPPGAFDGGG